MTKAYSYIRFSTPEQIKGDSLRRQLDRSRAYAKQHNLELDENLNMQDLGISAFKGANVTTGSLGAFIKAVESQTVPRGSYLLVESLDRLSRNNVKSALQLFLEIINLGIVIVTLSDGMKYDEKVDMQELTFSLMVMSRAHNESQMKSDRGTHSWNNKFTNAKAKPVTKWMPGWLTLTSDGKIISVPERVELIKKIFEWTLSGRGTRLIIKEIERADIEPWGASPCIKLAEGDRNRKPQKWHASRISRIISDRALLGEYQPRKGRPNAGPIITDYYPKIIGPDVFAKAQEVRALRDSGKGFGSGPKGTMVTNVLSGLLKCGYSKEGSVEAFRCEGNATSMTLVNKGPRSQTRYLQCSRVKEGNKGCEACNKSWRYNDFENSFLAHMKDVDLSIIFGEEEGFQKKSKAAEVSLSGMRASLNANNKRIQKIMDAIDNTDVVPKAFLEEVGRLEEANKVLEIIIKDKFDELDIIKLERMQRVENGDELKSILMRLNSLAGDDLREARLKLSHVLRQSIVSIDVYTKGQLVEDSMVEKVRKVAGNEAAAAVVRSNAQSQERFLPFFIITYRGGERRLVIPNPHNPDSVSTTVKWNESGILDHQLNRIQ